MNRRMNSLNLMAELQPFTQLGCLTALEARTIVEDYKKSDTTKLKSFIYDPKLPSSLTTLLDKLKEYI